MATAKPGWDPRKAYDISPQERVLIEKRAAQRVELKAEWTKKLTDPHKPGFSFVFDPAHQRWFATRSGGYQYFKPTPYNALLSLGLVFLPPLVMYKFAKRDRDDYENKVRTGQVAYKDRRYRLQ